MDVYIQAIGRTRNGRLAENLRADPKNIGIYARRVALRLAQFSADLANSHPLSFAYRVAASLPSFSFVTRILSRIECANRRRIGSATL